MNEEEHWLPVVGYEGWYEVSDLGRVRRKMDGPKSTVGRIRRLHLNGYGYFAVQLSAKGGRKTRHVHRLVAEAFLGKIPPGHEVNHISGVKTDNRLSNLEVVTRSHNRRHAIRMGLVRVNGEDNPNSKLTNDLVMEIRANCGDGSKYGIKSEYARRLGVDTSLISQVVLGRAWKHLDGGGSKNE